MLLIQFVYPGVQIVFSVIDLRVHVCFLSWILDYVLDNHQIFLPQYLVIVLGFTSDLVLT